MSHRNPMLEYARPGIFQPRWPWWADLLFAMAVVGLVLVIILPMFVTAGQQQGYL